MSSFNTIFNFSDNSGVKKAKCLSCLNNKKTLEINNMYVSVVKSCKKKSKFIKKSDIIKTLSVHTKFSMFNKYKSIKFYNNSLVLLNKKSFKNKGGDINEHKNKIKETLNIKLIGIIPFLIMNKLSKFKINLKKAIFI